MPAAGSAGSRSQQGTAVAGIEETLHFSFIPLGESTAMVFKVGDNAPWATGRLTHRLPRCTVLKANNSQILSFRLTPKADRSTQEPSLQSKRKAALSSLLLPSPTSQRKGRPIASLLGSLALGCKFLRGQIKELETCTSTCP